MKKIFVVLAAVFGVMLFFCGRSFALSYCEPSVNSFLGETVLTNNANMNARVAAWSWLETIDDQDYIYCAYRILNDSQKGFLPYISSFGVSNYNGITTEITGSATSDAGKNPWIGISLPENTDWFALSAQDLIAPGHFSNKGKNGLANDYFEVAVLGREHSFGLVNAYAGGGGSVAIGQVYGVMPEPHSINLGSFVFRANVFS